MVVLSALLLAGGARAGGAAAPTKADTPGGAVGGDRLTLVTGDEIVRPGGGPSIVVRHATEHGPGRAFRSVTVGSHRYAFPVSAGPYLTRTLDPALFDIGALTATGALQVHLTYRPGSTTGHDVPGVTVTRQISGGADGYLTAASARRFGAALADQYLADQRAGEYGGSGLFAGISGIAPLSGGTAPATVRPAYPMYTLALTVLDASGGPLPEGVVTVVNMDDERRFAVLGYVYHGVANFSVPAGHYSVTSDFVTYDAASDGFENRFVTLPEVTVTAARSLVVDARTATTPVTVAAPAGTAVADTGFSYLRQNGDLATNGGWWSDPHTDGLWTAPTAPVTVGTLRYRSSWNLAGDGISYDAVFPSDGQIPATQDNHLDPASLVRIDTRYASERPGSTVYAARGALTPGFGYGVVDYSLPVPAPSTRTEYATTGEGVAWQKVVFLNPATGSGYLVDDLHAYQAGQRLADDWGMPLRHPQARLDNGVGTGFVPAADRRGDSMLLNLQPFGDSTPGHVGSLDDVSGLSQETSTWTLYAGDTAVGDGVLPFGTVAVPAEAQDYRLVLDADRDAPWWRLSTATHTEWRFRSAHQSGGSLPDRWQCSPFEETPDCAVLPLLMPQYALATVDESGRAPAGPETLDVTVAPVQGAAPAAITSVSVDVSYDGGRTWQPTTVTGSGGHVTASYTHPDPAGTDGYVAVRTSATDAAGDAVTQTLTRAYGLAS